MFKPIEEYEEGDNCTNCWGPGKTFDDVPTPKRIEMTGSGFSDGCAVCNGTFILTQTPGSPCQWEFDNGTARGLWRCDPAVTYFKMGISGGADCYTRTEGLCKKISTFVGKTVSIEIAEPPTPEYKIAIDQNFSPSLLTHFLNLGAANGDEVSVIARRRDQVRLHVRFSPEY